MAAWRGYSIKMMTTYESKSQQPKGTERISSQGGGSILGKSVRGMLCLSFAFAMTGGVGRAAVLFVSATAAPGGNGSQQAPFNSLAAVEQASAPGDEIVVLASPMNVPPLNGGIALKPHQKLTGRGPSVIDGAALTQAPRITNSTADRNSGDAVVLADYSEVSNLMILNSYRGGIYGVDVTQVNVHDNNLAGTNTSCTPGFYVYFPVNQPLLPNGWAAIMTDEGIGTRSILIRSNYIHDGTCNDGIDIRASGTAIVMARVDDNKITHLAEGQPTVRSLLGNGMQTHETAVLTVESDHNSETYIGSANSDCEGLFTNQAGGSLTWNVSHNTFAHGIGGASCNGGEFFLSSGPATMNVYVSHSTFEDNPGDMIEEINEAIASTINLTLEDVTVKHTTHPTPFPPEEKFGAGAVNRSRCVAQSLHGHQNVNNLRVMDSRFSDCVGDGIGSAVNGSNPFPEQSGGEQARAGGNASATTGATAGAAAGAGGMNRDFGDGVGDSVSIDIENSTIDGTDQDAFHFMNLVAMKQVTIRVVNSQFNDARGPAAIAIDQNISTEQADIDLGGKASDSAGGNCITGATNLDLEETGYDVSAKSNWWGRPEGPLPAKISATDGNLNLMPVLRVSPPACKGIK
jgi:hypothetical protein